MSFDEQMREYVQTTKDAKPAGQLERISTAALQGLIAAHRPMGYGADYMAKSAVELARALIAELDRKGEEG